MHKAIIAPFAGLLLLSPVFMVAEHTATAGEGATETGAMCAHSLSWDEFKAACENPGAFNRQLKPENIVISCGDVRDIWVPETTGLPTYQLNNKRVITTALQSSKFCVDGQSIEQAVRPTLTNCPMLRLVRVSTNQAFSVSCDDVTTYQGTLEDFCLGQLDQSFASHPEQWNRQATQYVVNLCGEATASAGAAGAAGGK